MNALLVCTSVAYLAFIGWAAWYTFRRTLPAAVRSMREASTRTAADNPHPTGTTAFAAWELHRSLSVLAVSVAHAITPALISLVARLTRQEPTA